MSNIHVLYDHAHVQVPVLGDHRLSQHCIYGLLQGCNSLVLLT